MHYIKLLITLHFIIVWVSFLQAQEREEKQLSYGINFGYAYNTVSTGDLGKYLLGKGFYPVENEIEYYLYGISFLHRTNSLISIGLRTGKSMNNSENNSTLKAFGVNINYAYDICKLDKWLIAPNIGLQMNSYQLNLQSEEIQVTTGSFKPIKSKKYLPIAELGIQAMRKFSVSYVKVSLGLRVNYNKALGTQNWGKLPNQLSSMPGIDLNGFTYAFTGIVEFDLIKH